MRNHRTYGGIPGAFLTFSLLLLVMVIGFVVGRVVARSYTKAPSKLDVSSLPERQTGAKPTEEEQAPEGLVYVPSPASPREPPERAPAGEPEEITGSEAQQEQQPEPGVEAPAAALPSREVSAEPAGGARPRESEEANYSIQVGVFTLREGARGVAEELTRAGHAARIEVESRDGQPVYRVLTGEYESEQEARRAQEALDREGFPGFLVRP